MALFQGGRWARRLGLGGRPWQPAHCLPPTGFPWPPVSAPGSSSSSSSSALISRHSVTVRPPARRPARLLELPPPPPARSPGTGVPQALPLSLVPREVHHHRDLSLDGPELGGRDLVLVIGLDRHGAAAQLGAGGAVDDRIPVAERGGGRARGLRIVQGPSQDPSYLCKYNIYRPATDHRASAGRPPGGGGRRRGMAAARPVRRPAACSLALSNLLEVI